MKRFSWNRTPALPASLVLVLVLAAPLAAEHRQEVRKTFTATSGLVVELENLAGKVTVEGTSGGEVEVVAVIVADDERLAKELTIDFEEHGGRLEVRADYPVEDYGRFHYPGSDEGSGGGFAAWLFGGGSSNVRYQDRKVSVVGKKERGAVTLYADFTLRLPPGVGAEVKNHVGDIAADGVDGPLELDTGSGNVRSENGRGKLDADTGSGNVAVLGHRGDVVADTGSGNVELDGIEGSVNADTGSGNVSLRAVRGERVRADTGSGNVELDGVEGELELDTGSGRVEGRRLRVSGRLVADTGSGGVRLEGDFSAVREVLVDTGSGGVTLEGSFPGLDLDVSTGSGSIDVDLPDLEVIKKEKDYLRARTGGGGVRVKVETGSGGVRISG